MSSVIFRIIAILVLTTTMAEPARATLATNGPPVYVFQTLTNGTTSPSTASGTEPSIFNAGTNVFGSATPPAANLQSATSTFSGNVGTYLDITASANALAGAGNMATCLGFTYTNANGCVDAADSSLGNIYEIVAVQSWPFYIDTASASNLTPGIYTFSSVSDDASWVVVAPASFTYAQPGNFQGATGLTAATAVVNNSGVHGSATVTGPITLATSATCASNVYWATWEYAELVGGAAGIGYGWKLPGASATTTPTQSVLYGQVSYLGAGVSGATLTVPLVGGGTTTLTTDSNGCYGYNYPSNYIGTSTPGTVKMTDSTLGASQTSASQSVTEGAVTLLNFTITPPAITLYKRITSILRNGTTITVPNDSGNPSGVNGSSNYQIYPGDQITYTIYYANTGGATAIGPKISDALPSPLVYSSASATCANPPSGNPSATFTQASNGVTWTLGSSLLTAGSATVQGCVSVSANVP